jgi:tetratricopeptide (TPR) repeat protein
VIVPHERMALNPILFDLKKDNELFQAKTDRSEHWTIIGYKQINPFEKKERYSDTSINFPVTFSNTPLPYVGGLDLKGNPIEMTQIKDVSEYINIKKLYENKQYEDALEKIGEMEELYPQSVFKSEVSLYKIRVYHQLKDLESLLGAAKKFIREFSSDQNIAEVLLYTAHAYSKLGMFTDADYFFDHLFNEHTESYFARLGQIYKGDQFADAGSWDKALAFYMKALNETDDADLAAVAAFKIAEYEFDRGKHSEAKIYISKIIEGNKKYFYDHFDGSYKMAMALSDHNHFKEAAHIADALLMQMNPRDDLYEEVLKNRSIWLAQAKEKDQAVESFDRYLKEFKYGQYVDEIKREKDAMFFDIDDNNLSSALEAYDILIERYIDDEIAQKALYRKAKLYFDNALYTKVLSLQEALMQLDDTAYETKKLIDGSAMSLMKEHLQMQECKKAVGITQQYNIVLSNEWDAKIYFCADQSGNYTLAKTTALKYIKSKEIIQRLQWLYNYIKVDFKLGNYTDVIDASKEIITLLKLEQNNSYNEVYRLSFDANERLNNSDAMIEGIKNIENVFGLDYQDIERYVQMIALGNRKKDDVMIENFAKKVIYLQEKKHAFSQSPYVEFALSDALVKLNKNSEAIEIIKSLDDRNISNAQRSRQKYMLGSMLQKSSKIAAAKEAYEQSMQADATSAWSALAKDALELTP